MIGNHGRGLGRGRRALIARGLLGVLGVLALATCDVSELKGAIQEDVAVGTARKDGRPYISLGSSSVSFYAVPGGEGPAAKTVAITNSGGGILGSLGASVSYSGSASGWLTVSASSSALTLAPNSVGLPAGSYAAQVSLASNAVNGTVSVDVSLVVSDEPGIGLSASSLSFSGVAGGSNPGVQTVSVSNVGSGTLSGLTASVSYSSGSGWLSASLDATTAPATLTVQASLAGLSAGSYGATISVAASGAGNSPQTIAVGLSVASATSPVITLSTASVSFLGAPGGSSPASQTVQITNGGGGILSGLSTSISYSSGSGWLSASLDATTAPATLTVQAATGSLAAGSYAATISVASSVATNSPRTISISFTLSSTPSISLSSSSLSFAASPGGSSPASQTVQITNGGGGSLSGLSASVSYSSGSGWLSASLDTTTAPATLTVQATTGSLSAGSYAATISMASSVASNSPRSISVSLTLSATGGLSVSLSKRLLVVDAWQEVDFASQASRLCSVVVPEYGSYSLSWSDSKQGDGSATVDVAASMYDASGAALSAVSSVDSAYTAPITLSLSPGTYFLVLSSYSRNPVSGSCAVRFVELGDQDQYIVSRYQRLLVVDDYTLLTFSGETAKWLVLTIAAAGSYEFRWSDSKDGRGSDTADVALSLFKTDKTTVVGGFSAIDSGYTSPRSASLAAGIYLLEVTSFSGNPISGTCCVKAAPLSTNGAIVVTYYQRLLVVRQLSVVSFASQTERDLVVTLPSTGTYTFVMSDGSQSDGTDSVDALASVYDESGFPVGSYTGIDSAYAGVQLTLPAGTYHIALATKDAQPASGTCKVMLF